MNIFKKIYNFIYNNFLFLIITFSIIYFIFNYYNSFKIIEPISKDDDKEVSDQAEKRYNFMENM